MMYETTKRRIAIAVLGIGSVLWGFMIGYVTHDFVEEPKTLEELVRDANIPEDTYLRGSDGVHVHVDDIRANRG